MNEPTSISAVRRTALAAFAALALAVAAVPAGAADANAALVEEARIKARKHDLRGALQSLDKAIAADPLNAEAHILYEDLGRDVLGVDALVATYRQRAEKKPDEPLFAFLYARLLAPDLSLAAFEKQVLAFPSSPWPHAGRARALEASGRTPEAAAEYDAAVAAAPTDLRFRAFQAYGMEKAGNWAGAADGWRTVLARQANDRGARMGLGEALRKTGAFEEALATFGEALKADPNDAEAVYRVGLVHMDSGKRDEALKSFDAAIAVDKMFTEAYCAATECAIKAALETAQKEKRYPVEKDFEKAIGYGDKAAAVGADKADAHFALAAALEAAGESNPVHYERASAEYDAALGMLPIPGPEKLRALCAKSYVLLRLGKWDQAIATADKALGIDEKCAAAYSHAGHALAAQDRQDEAIKKYYRPGLKLCPEDAPLRHGLGVALWETKHEFEAKKELEAAVRLDPENPRFRLTLGELYYTQKNYKPAGEMLCKVVEARPYDVEAWRSYGRVCCNLADWDQAVESYEKICTLLESAKPAPPAAPPVPPAPGGGQPGAPPAPADPATPDAGAAGTDPDGLLVKAHLYLAIIYNDHLKKRDKAKEHIKKFLALGGSDQNLQSWIDELVKDG